MTSHTWLALACAALVPAAQAQTAPAATVLTEAWQQCAATTDNATRLACFDTWARQQQPLTPPPATSWQAPAASAQQQTPAALTQAANAPMVQADVVADPGLVPTNGGCRDPRYSEMSRFFELETGTDCGTFSFRGYKPLSVAVITADTVNTQPSSPGKPPATAQNYRPEELRIQLSARTKVASGLLTNPTSGLQDSVWVGYTQQSYWQVFSPALSRPFRTTDHEPEVFYVYPTQAKLPFGWQLRYSGIGMVHHSNGQSEPLSRSWNRWYLMTGAELSNRWQVHAKLWKRMAESTPDDDNPGIQNYWGRGELKLLWQPNENNTLGLTARGSVGKGYGSGRLEWLRTIGQGWNGGKSNLRLHVQLFSGYGESLIDYNRKRTSLSVGLSLLDF
ncbi:phospholipase A [Comamonas avium]|uniref:Phospholipase A1 n=1 Tax=Comamonas avium TaxID=2762231 RepID=A0ABR8S8K0_9BURK|nr:phospholipase A [Comamonas avium]MBD7959798.1 phospholipase A [Comamonas avium]